MNIWKPSAVLVAVLVFGPPAEAASKNFDDYWNEATRKPGAVVKEYSKVIVVTDEKDNAVYVFTKPDNPAHPGVIVRKLTTDKDGTYFDTEGHSYAPDSAQPAFKAWMDNPLQ